MADWEACVYKPEKWEKLQFLGYSKRCRNIGMSLGTGGNHREGFESEAREGATTFFENKKLFQQAFDASADYVANGLFRDEAIQQAQIGINCYVMVGDFDRAPYRCA